MKELRQYLINQGIDLDIYIGSLVDNNCIGLFETAGEPPIFLFDKGYIKNKGLQILVRHKSYEEGSTIINNIFKILNNTEGYKPSQNPFSLGRTENGYEEFSVNYIKFESEVM